MFKLRKTYKLKIYFTLSEVWAWFPFQAFFVFIYQLSVVINYSPQSPVPNTQSPVPNSSASNPLQQRGEFQSVTEMGTVELRLFEHNLESETPYIYQLLELIALP
ncbi:MAG: hypothetical protein RLZZ507_1365 [Cyanobacteriota bacterium]|jgi:hypothetical protein